MNESETAAARFINAARNSERWQELNSIATDATTGLREARTERNHLTKLGIESVSLQFADRSVAAIIADGSPDRLLLTAPDPEIGTDAASRPQPEHILTPDHGAVYVYARALLDHPDTATARTLAAQSTTKRQQQK